MAKKKRNNTEYGLDCGPVNSTLLKKIKLQEDSKEVRKAERKQKRIAKKELEDSLMTKEQKQDRELRLEELRRERIERYVERRKLKIYAQLPVNRKCPLCDEIKLSRREWRIEGDLTCCAKCFNKTNEVVA